MSVENDKLREEMRKKVQKIRKIKLSDYKQDGARHSQWGTKKRPSVIIKGGLLVDK